MADPKDVFTWGAGNVDPCDLHPLLAFLPGVRPGIKTASARLLCGNHSLPSRLEVTVNYVDGTTHIWTAACTPDRFTEVNGRKGFVLPAPLAHVTVWAPTSGDYATLLPQGGWDVLVR